MNAKHRIREWWFRTYRFDPNKMYGNWATCTDYMSIKDARAALEPHVRRVIPREHLGRVRYLSGYMGSGLSIEGREALVPYIGWKYVPYGHLEHGGRDEWEEISRPSGS